MKTLVIALLLITVLVGCTAPKIQEPIKNEPADFGSQKTGFIFHKSFSMEKPVEWKEATLVANTIYKYFPPDADPKNQYAEQVTVIVSNITNKNLTEIVEAGIQQNKAKLMPDLTVLDGPIPTNVGSLEGIKIKYSGSVKGKIVEFTQVFAQNEKKVLVLTYACLIGECKNYNIFNAMVQSAKIA